MHSRGRFPVNSFVSERSLTYICAMRIKDIEKEKAVVDATIKLVNENGLNNTSISKIAKEAGVSQATLYIYYQNKEDLVVSIFYNVKERLTTYYHNDLDDNCTIEENLRTLWVNSIKARHYLPELVSYDLQFTNSPFNDLVDSAKVLEFTKPLARLVEKGIREKVIKEMSLDIFIAFFLSPASFLSSKRMSSRFTVTEQSIEDTFQLAFKTIRY